MPGLRCAFILTATGAIGSRPFSRKGTEVLTKQAKVPEFPVTDEENAILSGLHHYLNLK